MLKYVTALNINHSKEEEMDTAKTEATAKQIQFRFSLVYELAYISQNPLKLRQGMEAIEEMRGGNKDKIISFLQAELRRFFGEIWKHEPESFERRWFSKNMTEFNHLKKIVQEL